MGKCIKYGCEMKAVLTPEMLLNGYVLIMNAYINIMTNYQVKQK